MSRAYRVRVRESLRRVIRAEDHVSTQLEVLQILPADQMADLLAAELEEQGFQREGDVATRCQDGVVVTVDLASGTVNVSAEASENVSLEGKKEGYAYDDYADDRQRTERQLRVQLAKELEDKAASKEGQLQKNATDLLEGCLADLREELDQAVNRATAAALKQKAAQIGQIKEVTEDPESGSMTIVVEV